MHEIKIACTGAGLEDYRDLVDFQGGFKERTDEDIENMVASILKHGWSYPFFVWKNGETKYIFDGHGRKPALSLLESRGYIIPLLPSAYIFADNIHEAKIKLLKLNARYGSLTESSYTLFTKNMSEIDLDGVSIKFDIPQKINVDAEDYTENLDKIDEFGHVEIKIICPGCTEESSFTVKELLELTGE